jgi:hypothetical protein
MVTGYISKHLLNSLVFGMRIRSTKIMIGRRDAKKIGYSQAFKAITLGIFIAYFIMALTSFNPVWLLEFDYMPTILFGVVILYCFGYLFGRSAGVSILVKKRPAILFGIIYGFVIVWSATLAASLVGFAEVLADRDQVAKPLRDYVYKPLVMITFYGFIPIVLIGVWYGYSIKKYSKN